MRFRNHASWISKAAFSVALLAGLSFVPTRPAVAGSPTLAACDGPFTVRSATRTYVDAARANRRVGATVYFPTSGSRTSIVAGCNLPVVSFGHGFTIGNGAYGFVPQRLVPAGYVVVMPSTEGGLAPDHGRFADDLAFVIRAVRNDAAFAGALGPRSAIAGHSMGGGAAVLGASRNADVTALFAFAPAETKPSAIAAAARITAPTLIFSGSRDCVTPYAKNAGPMLAALATPDASTYDAPINGASHCQFSTGSFTCSVGEGSCGGRATISAAQQQQLTLDTLVPFLDMALKGR